MLGYYVRDNEACIDGISAGKERDSESGLDWWSSRYYGSALGRFTSPDPIGFGGAKPRDPQSWNQYAYARNNPLLYTDPDGFSYQICDATGKNCAKDQLSDDDFNSEKSAAQSNGEHFSDGSIYHYDSGGNRVNDGTYTQTDVDLSSGASTLIRNLGQNADAQQRFVGKFAGYSAALGLTGGLISFYGPELLGAEASSAESDIGSGLRKQIDLHKQKLADYIKDPDAYDNKGFLKCVARAERKDHPGTN